MLDNDTPTNNSIPYGYCHCGCGRKTNLSTRTNRRLKQVKGEPHRYVIGHHPRRRRANGNSRKNKTPIRRTPRSTKHSVSEWVRNGDVAYALTPAGERVLISIQDVERVGGERWGVYLGYVSSNRQRTSLHRFIMNPPKDMVVDHINGDGLDNRRENLRICTHAENTRNRRSAQKNSKSGYIGVYPRRGKWLAEINVDGECIRLGMFKNIDDAIAARDAAAIRYHGEFASLNRKRVPVKRPD